MPFAYRSLSEAFRSFRLWPVISTSSDPMVGSQTCWDKISRWLPMYIKVTTVFAYWGPTCRAIEPGKACDSCFACSRKRRTVGRDIILFQQLAVPLWPPASSGGLRQDTSGKCGHQRAAQAAASAYCNMCAGSSLWPVKGYCQRLHQALHSLQDHNVTSWNVRIPLGLYIESKQRYGKCFACGHAAFADASFPTHKGCNWADSAHLIFRQ